MQIIFALSFMLFRVAMLQLTHQRSGCSASSIGIHTGYVLICLLAWVVMSWTYVVKFHSLQGLWLHNKQPLSFLTGHDPILIFCICAFIINAQYYADFPLALHAKGGPRSIPDVEKLSICTYSSVYSFMNLMRLSSSIWLILLNLISFQQTS